MAKFRFLFFLYTYPPDPGSAPKRNYRLSHAIAKRSDAAIIFTAAASEIEKSLLTSQTVVKHISAMDYRKISRKKNKFNAFGEYGKQSAFAQSAIRLINTFPFSILLGEGGLLYYLKLVREGQSSISNAGITHIYSSFRPFADHYAAYTLKKKNPELIWIADFRDLIIDPHYQHIYFQQWHHRFFRKIFGKADVLTTVSAGLQQHLKTYHSNVIVLKNGISEEEIKNVPPTKNQFFTIAYTGSMFLDKRNPEPIFRGLQNLKNTGVLVIDDIRLVNAGKDPAQWTTLARKYKMENFLDIRGIVSSEKATQIQQQSCINILLTVSSNALQGVLTGKFIEYVQAGSPVLAICVGQNDPELKTALQQLEIGNSFSDHPSDQKAIQDFLLEEYTAWKISGMNRKPVNLQTVRANYAEEVVMKPLFDLLETK